MTNRPLIPAAVLMASGALALAPLPASACPSGAPMSSSPSRAGGSSGGAGAGDTGAAEGGREAAAAGAGLDAGDDSGPRRSDGQAPVAQEAGAIAGVATALNNDAQSTSPETDRQTTATQAAQPADETESPELAAFYGQPWWTRVDDDPPASDPGPTGGDKGFWDSYFGPPTYPNAPSFVAAVPAMVSGYWRMWTQQDVYEDRNVNPRWKEWHDLPWYQRYLTEPPPQHLDISGGGVRG